MLNAVIFDLDGTLVDSEVIWHEVTQEIVESFGKEFDDSIHTELLGASGPVCMNILKERFNLPAEVEELLKMNNAIFDRKIKVQLPPKKEGADALMESLRASQIPYALATSGNRSMVEYVLSGHGWLEHFHAVVTLEDVENPKPASDIYDEALRRLGFDAATCVAFEDAIAGVKSAQAAGIKVVGMANAYAGNALEIADRQIQSFEEVNINDLRNLL